MPAALRLACDRPFYSTSGAQCVIRPSASRLSASCAQLRIHTVCLLSPASTVCVRPARRPSGHCHARPSARVSSTGLETQGPEASLLLLQRNLVYAPLRSAHHRGPSQLAGSFFSADRQRKNCSLRSGLLFIPRGRVIFFPSRRPPHRRWVHETQPHTCGCAERILTAEFQLDTTWHNARRSCLVLSISLIHCGNEFRNSRA